MAQPRTVLKLSKQDITRFVRRLAIVLFGHGLKRQEKEKRK